MYTSQTTELPVDKPELRIKERERRGGEMEEA